MKLVARLLGEHPQLVERLKKEGYRAKHVRGAAVVDLCLDRTRAGVYRFPPGVDPATEVLIEVAECGGSGDHNGGATIVCGLSGGKMKPYFRPMGTEARQVQAWFATPIGLCLIQATSYGGQGPSVIGYELRTARETDHVALQRRQLFQLAGPHQLIGAPAAYTAAVRAAVAKVQCRGCRHMHYGEVK